jgi:hypothetical protein
MLLEEIRYYLNLSTAEKTTGFKELLKKKSIIEFKKRTTKDNILTRAKPGMLKWHTHKSRAVSRILFRIQTNHNRLKANLTRFNSEINPTCRD